MNRVQRKRLRGWRLPKGTVYVGRPTRWGNGFRMNPKSDISRRVAVGHYRRWLTALLREDTPYALAFLEPLRDATALSCWCPLDKSCHADVLIEAVRVHLGERE